jgi:hypothetical protein
MKNHVIYVNIEVDDFMFQVNHLKDCVKSLKILVNDFKDEANNMNFEVIWCSILKSGVLAWW